MTTDSPSLTQDVKQKRQISIAGKKIEKRMKDDLSTINVLMKRKGAAKTSSGPTQAASSALLLKKLGITPEEMNSLREKSLSQTRSLADKYEKTSSDLKVDVTEYLSNSVYYSNRPQTFYAGGKAYDLGITPVDIFIPSSAVYQGAHIHAEGNGDGWITQDWGGNADQYGFFTARFDFTFIPPCATFYSFGAGVLSAGPYYLIADDGTFTSKEASCSINASIGVYQQLPAPAPPLNIQYVLQSDYQELFSDGDDNISRCDIALGIRRMQLDNVYLYVNIPVQISVDCTIEVYAKGEGSVADMNFSGKNGAIACAGLNIKSI
jgi:hypothetical protein